MAVFVKIDQANIWRRIAQGFEECILILSTTIFSHPSVQLDQPGGAGKQTQKAPHFFVHANSHDGHRLTEIKSLSAGTPSETVCRQRFPFNPTPSARPGPSPLMSA